MRKKAKAPSQRRRITEVLRQASNRKRIIKYVVISSVLLVILLFVSGHRGSYQLYKFYSEKQAWQEEIENLENEIKELETEKKKLETDPAYIEKVAREKYKMKKKGERVFEIVEK